jgi:hypothetical protein
MEQKKLTKNERALLAQIGKRESVTAEQIANLNGSDIRESFNDLYALHFANFLNVDTRGSATRFSLTEYAQYQLEVA